MPTYKEAMGWRYPLKPSGWAKPPTTANPTARKWSLFEEEALLALMARQVHNIGDEEDGLELATRLNEAINDSDYRGDISPREIQKKVQSILSERPVFADTLARHKVGRVTRRLKQSFYRALNPMAER